MKMLKIINKYDAKHCFVKSNVEKGCFSKYYHLFRSRINNMFASFYGRKHLRFPIAIEIETVNKCNNDCPFCPVNRHNDPRQLTYMPDKTILKIANELNIAKYSGLLALFSNNEPLIDKRIVDICSLYREKAPSAHIYLYTNGILLNYDLYIKLFEAGLDELIIDNYKDDLTLITPVQKLTEQINKSENSRLWLYLSKTKILLRKKSEILTNRAGLSPNKNMNEFQYFKYYNDSSCVLPFIQLVIRPDGGISKCCQDAYGKETLGNMNTNTIYEIWNGNKFAQLRMSLAKFGRKSQKLCQKCDVSIINPSQAKQLLFAKKFYLTEGCKSPNE